MPVRIVQCGPDLAATLRLHLGELVSAPGPEVSVGGEGADVPAGPDYLRPRAPGPVGRALARARGGDVPLHRGVLERTCALLSRVRARLGRPPGRGARFLLRVDDFPRWDLPLEEFLAFHAALGGAPYLLGVTPRLARNPLDPRDDGVRELTGAERAALRRVCAEGATPALHGLTHRTRRARPHSELEGLDEAACGRLCDEGLAALGMAAPAFIPPFNHFGPAAWPALEKRFRVVSAGGRESLSSFGSYTSPARLGRALYVPAYAPAYGRAAGLRTFAAQARAAGEDVWVPLVLHWAWERADGFREVAALARSLRGRLVPWQELIDEAGRMEGASA